MSEGQILLKVVLIQPPIFWTTTPPLGPAYLAGEALAAGYEVRLFDFNIGLFSTNREAYCSVRLLVDKFGHASPLRRTSTDEISAALRALYPCEFKQLEHLTQEWAARVIDERANIVGISIHEESLLVALLLARRLRQERVQSVIVVGGPETIFLHRDARFLEEGLFDFAVVGEGEGPFRQIAAYVRDWNDRPATSGLDIHIPGTVVVTPKGIVDAVAHGSLVDINTIATPSFEGFPLDAYTFPNTLPIVFSRGCPAKCTFCFETVMWQRFRLRSVENVIEEIQLRLRTYGQPLSFRFNDSLLNGDLAWLERFADAVLDAGLKMKWHGNARIHPCMTPRLLEKLAAAGLTGLLFGVESGSQKILNRMKKGVHASIIPRVLQDAHRAGIWTHAFLILDFPGEGDAELIETLDLVAGQLENLDSLVFHDFHLPPELVHYLNFTGRVPVDESESNFKDHDLAPLYRSNAAALRPFVDVFLENFLQFAHAHSNVHSMPIAPAHAQGLLDIYRKRWLSSPAFSRSRISLMAFRALIMELDKLRLTVLIKWADASLPLLQDRKVLTPQSTDPQERRLAALAYAGKLSLRRVVETVQRRLPSMDSCPAGKELLDLLFEALPLNDPATGADGGIERAVRAAGERLGPEGWR